MGIMDTLKALLGRAEQVAKEHPDQVKAAMGKAEGLVDDRTGHKFTSQIQAGGSKAAELLDGEGKPPTQP